MVEISPGAGGKRFVNLEGHDPASWTDHLCEYCRVVAGAATDLYDGLTNFEIQAVHPHG